MLKVSIGPGGLMDKTYADIKAAFMDGIVFCVGPKSDGYLLYIVTYCYDYVDDGCEVALKPMDGTSDIKFACGTVDDYPERQQ